MEKFTVEQSNLICIYGGDTKAEIIANLENMQTHLQSDETDLIELTEKTLKLLHSMSDEEFDEAKGELVPDFE